MITRTNSIIAALRIEKTFRIETKNVQKVRVVEIGEGMTIH